MEDSKKKESQTNKDRRLVELTPAMELHSDRPVKIVELNNALQDKPAMPRRDLPPEKPVAQKTEAIETETPAVPPIEDSEPVADSAPPIPERAADPKSSSYLDVPVELDQVASAEDTVQTPIIDLGAEQPEDQLPKEDVSDLLSQRSEFAGQTVAPDLPAAAETAQPQPEEPSLGVHKAGETLDLTDVITPVDLMPEDDDSPIVDEPFREPELTLDDAPESDGADTGPADGQPVAEQGNAAETIDLTDVITPVDLMPPEEGEDVIEEAQPADDLFEEPELALDLDASEPAGQMEGEPESSAVDFEDAFSLDMDDSAAEAPELADAEPAPVDTEPDEPEAAELVMTDDTLDMIDIVDAEETATSPRQAAEMPVEPMEPQIPEEEPIELTDTADPAQVRAEESLEPALDEQDQAEEVIELIDAADPAQVRAEESLEPALDEQDQAEEVIELTDAADPAQVRAEESLEPALDEQDQAEEVIELTDAADPAQVRAEESLEPALDEQDQAEEVIELTDAADPAQVRAEESLEPALDEQDQAEEVIELTDAADPAQVRAEESLEPAVDEQDLVEDAIELIDVAEPQKTVTAKEDDTIELIDVVDLDEMDTSAGDDDDTIELLDKVDAEQVTAAFESMQARSAALDSDIDEDDILELIDIVDPAELDGIDSPLMAIVEPLPAQDDPADVDAASAGKQDLTTGPIDKGDDEMASDPTEAPSADAEEEEEDLTLGPDDMLGEDLAAELAGEPAAEVELAVEDDLVQGLDDALGDDLVADLAEASSDDAQLEEEEDLTLGPDDVFGEDFAAELAGEPAVEVEPAMEDDLVQGLDDALDDDLAADLAEAPSGDAQLEEEEDLTLGPDDALGEDLAAELAGEPTAEVELAMEDDLVQGLDDALDDLAQAPSADAQSGEEEDLTLGPDDALNIGTEWEDDLIDTVDGNGPDDLDLLDAIEPDADNRNQTAEKALPDSAPTGTAARESLDDTDDQVIHLDSVLRHVSENKKKIVEDITQGVEEELVRSPLGADFEGGAAVGMNLDEVKEALGNSINLDNKDLEKVIEQIIRTKYAETIEQYIASTVERVVTREMESIKHSLMEDHGEDDE